MEELQKITDHSHPSYKWNTKLPDQGYSNEIIHSAIDSDHIIAHQKPISE